MFDPVVSIWSMTIAACATLGAIHVLLWSSDHRATSSLAFVALVASVAGMAALELMMMNTRDVATYVVLMRYTHLCALFLTASILATVRVTFGARYDWLAALVIALRILVVVVGFLVPTNATFSALHELRQVEFLGSTVSVPIGTTSPWGRLGESSSVLMLLYVVLAAWAHARTGLEARRQALTIGAGLAFFVLAAAGMAITVNNGLAQIPYIMSLPSLGIVAVVAYEMARALGSVRRISGELHESQQRNELAASAAGLGLFSWNVDSRQAWSNDIARSMHGLGADMPQDPARILERVHPEDRVAVRAAVLRALQEHGDFEVVYRAEAAPAQWRWIEARGAVERLPGTRALRGVCLDMSERRAADERFRRVVEAAPNAMLLVDMDGRITLANDQAGAMFGCESSALLGRAVDDFAAGLPASTHAAHRRQFGDQPEARRMGAGRELHARRADGSEFVVEVGLSPIITREGPQVMASIVDVTVRRQEELELQRLREQSFSAARISLAGQLASTLAHEINQPLGAILRNAEAASLMLERGDADPAEIAAILADIRSDDQRAGAIIEHMRSLLRRKRPELVPVPLEELVAKVVALVRHDVAAHHVALQTQVPQGIAAVRADPVQLQQVLLNLVFNGLDALEQVPKSARRLVLSARMLADGQVELVVRDTGTGLSKETLAHVFEPFHTTKANGMGMGLAICRSLVESMGGSIDANNQFDGGAAFRIVLPSAGAPAPG